MSTEFLLDDEDYAAAHATVQEALRTGDYATAAELAVEMLRRYPSSDTAMVAFAHAVQLSDEGGEWSLDDARAALAAATRIQSLGTEAAHEYGRFLCALDDDDPAALEVLERALEHRGRQVRELRRAVADVRADMETESVTGTESLADSDDETGTATGGANDPRPRVRACVYVSGDSLQPETFSAASPVSPTEIGRKGQLLPGRRRPCPETFWDYEIDRRSHALDDVVEELLENFVGHEGEMRSVAAAMQAEVTVVCMVTIRDHGLDTSISAPTVAKLSALGAGFVLDVIDLSDPGE